MSEEDPSESWRYPFYQLINFILDKFNFSPIKDNENRISFVLMAISSHKLKNIIYNIEGEKKSSKISTEFRMKGNEFFTSTEDASLDKAVEEFTKSIAYAPNGSRELAFAYGNRSAVLFKARLISDCILDIERALENNYPDILKAKLYFRKAMCLQILCSEGSLLVEKAFTESRKWAKIMRKKKQKIMEQMLDEQEKSKSIDKFTFSKWNSRKFLPKLNAENPKIPGLSGAIELQYSKKWGRHMVAKKNIKPGETLVIQKAYAKVVQLNSRYKLCWNCGEQTWSSVPCKNCVEVVFCSEKCREEGNLAFHNFECPIIASMIASKIESGAFLALRLLIKAHKEVEGSIETLERNLLKIDDEKNPLMKGFTKNVLDPDKFASIYCLESHVNEVTGRRGFILGYSILIAYFLQTKSDFFGSKEKGNLISLSSNKKFIFIIGLLEKLIETTSVNNFRTPSVNGKNFGCHIIVPAFSFFNHSCYFMEYQRTFGDFMVSTACCPIKKGEQIFFCYGPNFSAATKFERQAHFSKYYYFSCNCEACENDWPKEPKFSHEDEYSTIPELIAEVTKIYNCNSIEICICPFSSHRPNREKNVTHDVARIVRIIKQYYSHGFQRNSLEVFMAERALYQLLKLTGDRILSLDRSL